MCGDSISTIANSYGLSSRKVRAELIENDVELRHQGKVGRYKKISNDLIGIMIGMLLGDSGFASSRKRKLMSTEHSLVQEEYLMWKYNKLKEYIGGQIYKRDRFDNRTHKIYQSITYNSATHPEIDRLYCEFFRDGTKQVTEEILEKLTSEGIAIWFCDDGNLYRYPKGYLNQITIATNSFDDTSLNLIIDMFDKKYGLKFGINKTNKSIRICNLMGIQKFYATFGSHIPGCMDYKKMVII